MNNPQFYIFGVPDGFDMYNATPERLNLFQLLYDSDCRERRKMAIYRNADNTEVSYIYLRYNMQSVKGRPNSFLGMALTFTEGYYCNDIPRVLNLFEEIYSALSKDVILTTRIIPSAGQARYRIGRFAEGTAAIIKIEEFVEAQTRGWFGDCVVPMDDTFRLNTQSVCLKHGLYLDTKSEHIIANMKTASWVYLSDSGRIPEPKPKPASTDTSPNQPTAPHTKPVPPAQRAAVPPREPQKQTPVVQPPSEPHVAAEQERQRGRLSELQGEFNQLDKAISDRQHKGTLSKERDELLKLQQDLNTLQYVVGTNESNILATQINFGIKRIDELLRKKKKAKKVTFSLLGSLAVIGLLIVLWPKPTPPQPTPIDIEPYISFCNSVNKRVSEIQNGLDTINKSLKPTTEYTKVQNLIDTIQEKTKKLNDRLSEGSLDSTKNTTLSADTMIISRHLAKLNKGHESLVKKSTEIRQPVTQTNQNKTMMDAGSKKDIFWWEVTVGSKSYDNPAEIKLKKGDHAIITASKEVYWEWDGDIINHTNGVMSILMPIPTPSKTLECSGKGNVKLYSGPSRSNKLGQIKITEP